MSNLADNPQRLKSRSDLHKPLIGDHGIEREQTKYPLHKMINCTSNL